MKLFSVYSGKGIIHTFSLFLSNTHLNICTFEQILKNPSNRNRASKNPCGSRKAEKQKEKQEKSYTAAEENVNK